VSGKVMVGLAEQAGLAVGWGPRGTVFEGMTGMPENVFLNVKNRSHTITAEAASPKAAARA